MDQYLDFSKKLAEEAGNIVENHSLKDKVRGVYFEGRAEKIDIEDKSHPVYKLFCSRLGKDEGMLEEAKKPNGHKFYKISAEKFYLFDARDSSPGQKFELKWISKWIDTIQLFFHLLKVYSVREDIQNNFPCLPTGRLSGPNKNGV